MEKSQKIGHKKQASNIHQWKPWLKAGVKTPEGKAMVSQNAWKHGDRSIQTIQMEREFSIRWKLGMKQADEIIAYIWLSNAIHLLSSFKATPEENRNILSNQSKRTLSQEGQKQQITEAYQKEWGEIFKLLGHSSL